MEPYFLLFSVLAGITLLLILILYFRLHAFIALFLASITVGVLSGMPYEDVLTHLKEGMGETLGYVAAVVGLGFMFGSILEYSGGALALAQAMVRKTGEKNAPWAIGLTGFLVGIPVFFEVGFIILFPMIHALQKKTGKPLLLYGIPLLAGLAISHSFIPPTPGPIAVAKIIGADLGWVVVTGIICGLPAAIIAGPIYGKFISKRIPGVSLTLEEAQIEFSALPPVGLILAMIGVPIGLIILNSVFSSPFSDSWPIPLAVRHAFTFIGHPFAALLLANLLTWYFLGFRRGVSKEKLLKITGDSLAPAGNIILIIGAGGMFKQILTETGAGKVLATAMLSTGASYLLFAFAIAALIRILQGSATVAMITAAGMTASLTSGLNLSSIEKALIVTSIASGATILSHVNDGGFWLVGRYFGLTEKQTLASWSVVTTIIAFVGLGMVLLVDVIVA